MAQVLYAQVRDDKGVMRSKEVKILRSWQDSNGAQIFMHSNGVYGYKDGTPIKDDKEFGIISDGIQKVIALQWWDKTGKKMSKDHYVARDKKLYALQQRKPVKSKGNDDTGLDTVLYVRSIEGAKNPPSEPMTWYTWFEERPEWWGLAKSIELGKSKYTKHEIEKEAIQ